MGMGPLLTTVVVALSVVAVALVLSNVLNYTNEVQGIALTSTWNSGAKALGTTNSFSVSYTSSTGAPNNAAIMFQLDRTGIIPSDVTLKYTVDSTTYTTTFVQNGPNSIVGTTAALVSGSTSGTYPYDLTYNAVGSYTMKVWVG